MAFRWPIGGWVTKMGGLYREEHLGAGQPNPGLEKTMFWVGGWTMGAI